MAEERKDWVDFKKIKETVKFETVLLEFGLLEKMRKSGDEWIGPCPLHDKKSEKPSFYVNTRKNTFHCFACKQSGNLLDFTKKVQHTDVRTAGLWLAQFLEEKAEPPQPASDPIEELRGHVDAVVNFLVSRVEQRLERREDFVRDLTGLVLEALSKVGDKAAK